MSNLEKINVLTKDKLDSLDLKQYPNQIFGTTDEVAEGGGSSITVDSEFSLTSKNPVQNKVITNKINGIIGESKNLFDVNTIVKGGELSGSTGEIVFGNSTKYVSDYIYIKGIANLYLSGNRTYGKGIAYYTDNKTFISTEILSGFTGVLTPPSTASYLRINGNLTDTNVQIEVGTEATEYEPYRSKLVYADDIADVEHVEVLYDKNDPTKQTFGGTTYTGGILGNTTITGLDMSKYQRLDIEYMTDVFCGRMSLGLTNGYVNTAGASADYPYMTSSCVVSESHQSIYYYRVGVNSAKTTFASIDVGFTRLTDATVNDRSNHPAYCIYKITGVLK